jgi:hypothetical protein
MNQERSYFFLEQAVANAKLAYKITAESGRQTLSSITTGQARKENNSDEMILPSGHDFGDRKDTGKH